MPCFVPELKQHMATLRQTRYLMVSFNDASFDEGHVTSWEMLLMDHPSPPADFQRYKVLNVTYPNVEVFSLDDCLNDCLYQRIIEDCNCK